MAEGRISWCSSPCCFVERFEWFFSHSHRVHLSSGRVLTSARRTSLTASPSLAATWNLSTVTACVRQVLTDSGDERGAHVRVGVGDLLRVAAVFGQVSGETSHRVRAAPLGGEQHPPEFHVGEDAHVVLALGRGGLTMPTLPTVEKSSQSRAACTWCSRTRQILVSCSRVISATFDTRHRLGEGQRQRLEQHREPRARPRPRPR